MKVRDEVTEFGEMILHAGAFVLCMGCLAFFAAVAFNPPYMAAKLTQIVGGVVAVVL